MDEPELKPCPFCGHEAYMESFPVRKGFEAVAQCCNCQASMQTVTFDTEEAAQQHLAKEWNRRAPADSSESRDSTSTMSMGPKDCTYGSLYNLVPELPKETFVPGRFVSPVKVRELSFRLMEDMSDDKCIRSTVRLTQNQHWKVTDYDAERRLVTLTHDRNTVVLPMLHASLLFEDYDQTDDGKPLNHVWSADRPQ